MDISNIILISVYILNFISILVLLFFKRKNPNETFAWLMALSFIPVGGLILYMLFGRGLNSDKKYSLKEQRDKVYSTMIESQPLSDDLNSFAPHDFSALPQSSSTARDYSGMVEMLYNTSHSIYTQDNEVEIFTDAKSKYDSLISDIKNAQETINLLYFIIKNDDIGRTIVDLLTEKAAQGVEVRIIYDGLGSFFTPGKMFKNLKKEGGKVCRFFPVSLGFYFKINHRNHRKIAIIDGKIAYMGGMNIGNEYMGIGKITPWRDTHLRIKGHAVWMLQERFLLDWNFASRIKDDLEDYSFFQRYFVPVSSNNQLGMQIVSSDPGAKGEQIKAGLIRMIYSARKNILIQTPYFVPDQPFLEALTAAAASGVDIKVMIPGLPDKKYVWYVTMSYVKDLLAAGIKVYLYDGFIHAKMLVMDDRVATIGSTNIDIRSFLLHFEINAFIYDQAFAQRCADIFAADEEHSVLVSQEWYDSRGLFTTMKENFFRLFSPLM